MYVILVTPERGSFSGGFRYRPLASDAPAIAKILVQFSSVTVIDGLDSKPTAANHDSGSVPLLALDYRGPGLLHPGDNQQGEQHGGGNLLAVVDEA